MTTHHHHPLLLAPLPLLAAMVPVGWMQACSRVPIERVG